MKYFCTSETIALYIQKYVQYRKRKVFFGATGKFADLLPLIVKHNTENISFQCLMYTTMKSKICSTKPYPAYRSNNVSHSKQRIYTR